MKTVISVRYVVKHLLQLAAIVAFMSAFRASCQIPELVISQTKVNTNAVAVLSWTNSAQNQLVPLVGIETIQTANSLSSPMSWTNLLIDSSGMGSTNFQITNSEQYFRLLFQAPIFSFAIFYNMNLEIAAAATLSIQGPVFSNAGFWSGSDTITFDSIVSAVGLVTNTTADPFCSGYSGSGRSIFILVNQPMANASPLIAFEGNTYTNPASAEAFLNLPPTNYMLGTSAAFMNYGQNYFANAADLYVTNFTSGTNWNSTTPLGCPMAVYYDDPANAPNYLTWVTNNFYIISNRYQGVSTILFTNYVPIPQNSVPNFQLTNNVTSMRYTNSSGFAAGTNQVWYAGYTFLTNALFYDWREGWHGGFGPPKTVQAVQLDIHKFNLWLTNTTANGGAVYNAECQSFTHKGHPIDSIYIYNAVPLTATTLPAVRTYNGGMLPLQDPYGFTLATAMPLYVWGDYNVSNNLGTSVSQNHTTYTGPAELAGDSITILSDAWIDSNSSMHTGMGSPAASTTINAACVAGIVQSNSNDPASDASGYSGGVENYFRLLENWAGVNFWYNGSIVALFPSQFATNCWQQTGGYYTAPTRHWASDTNFLNWTRLPPLTPAVANFITP